MKKRESKGQDKEFIMRRRLEDEIIFSHLWEQDHKASIAELAKQANITMPQAIQIAMSQQPGTVMQCRLIGGRPGGEGEQVFYILTIVSGDDSTAMLISAVDGRVVRTRKLSIEERASLRQQ